MSTRALRKLHGNRDGGIEDLTAGACAENGGPKPPEEDESQSSDADEEAFASSPAVKKNKKKKNKGEVQRNPFDLLQDVDPENNLEDVMKDQEDQQKADSGAEVKDGDEADRSPSGGTKKKKKRKKKKNKSKSSAGEAKENSADEDEIDASVREVKEILGEVAWHGAGVTSFDSDTHITMNMKALLNVEHKYLNPDNEMRRIFGSRVVQGDQNRNRRQRNRTYHKNTWLTKPKQEWPPHTKTGLSMELLETRNGCQYFTFEHNKHYQQIQFQFLDAVESLDPENIMSVLHIHAYHIDTLLQVSEICKMSDNTQMATDLIERSLYGFECNFHASFSLTQGTCRFDYRRPENRAFYIALFRHLIFVGQRGCYRTALEFCKLILSFDPEGDPLCVLLMLDFYALKSEQYSFLIRMFQEWEAHRNLSQLPNFAFSVALATYHTAIQEERETTEADDMLQRALLMYPGLLLPLLDKCSVAPDKDVAAHEFFGVNSQLSQPKALAQLVALYIGRSYPCWKEQEVMSWLEVNTRRALARVDAGDPLVKEYRRKRQARYRGTPRNIYRHVIMSDIQDAVSALPPDMAASPVMSFDPFPPTDSIVTYTRPERPRRAQQSSSTLASFFQSLLPNYNPQELVDETQGAAGGPDQGHDLRQGMVQLMDAMRDLLNNIRPVAPPVEGGGNDAQDDEVEDQEWD